MQIKPILSALSRHKAGTVLIAVQIALTLAIVCNALFIIHDRLQKLSQPSGVDESHVFVIDNQWVGRPDKAQVKARIQADLATLRGVPGVENAYATNSVPLRNGGWSLGVRHSRDETRPDTHTALYFVDQNAIPTLGLKLVAGRNFRADEVGSMGMRDNMQPQGAIITRALARKLFPNGSAVGHHIFAGDTGATVIGVVARMRVPWLGGWIKNWAQNSVLVPMRLLLSTGTTYVVRARPGQLPAAMRDAPKALFAADRMRVIDPDTGVRSYARLRSEAYRSDRGMAILMGVISLVLLAITGAGIVGLTSFWVGQRRKQIGVRRALGATRRDILSYFLTENFLIAGLGVLVGAVLALGLNLWLVTHFELSHMPAGYVLGGIVVLLLLGQGAVLGPAVRAASIPPVEATRTV
jgi:putative ABC transport system permease protein